MRGLGVARILSGVLIFQLGIGALLILGDMGGAFRLLGGGSDAPALDLPIRPGDQRRLFDPGFQPLTGPAPTGPLPERLTLTFEQGATYRLQGSIEQGDAERIRKQLAEAVPAPAILIVHSPGGVVHDALDLGRYIRAAGIETAMRAGEICYSACPYLLAAGVTRDIPETASVGVHQHYFGKSTVLPAAFAVEDIQRGQGEVMMYLSAMGIDPMVMQHALTTPPEEIYVLLPHELVAYGFIEAEP